MRHPLAHAICFGLLFACVATPRAAVPALTRAQSDAFLRKVDALAEPRAGAQARRVALTEAELNSWFLFGAPAVLPAGVTEPSVGMVGKGRVSGRVVVDLERLPRRRSGNLLDPLALLRGRVPVQVLGTLRTGGGMGTFDVESAQLAGITVPKFLIQELLAGFSRSSEHPEGLSLDGAFGLPVRIQRIDVEPGQALVVQ